MERSIWFVLTITDEMLLQNGTLLHTTNERLFSLRRKTIIFLTLDASSGYWRIKMYRNDVNKTAFVNHKVLYEYKRKPLGLMDGPATFELAIDAILAAIRWEYALVYIDNILVLSKTAEDYSRHLKSVFKLPSNVEIKIRWKKRSIFSDTIGYLSLVIPSGNQPVANKSIEGIKAVQYPTTVPELQSLLGLCNYHCRFVPTKQKWLHLKQGTEKKKTGSPPSWISTKKKWT